jgi:hypothetical protein
VLGPGRYLLGVLELLLLGGFAWLGAARVRAWLLPRLEGAPGVLATVVLATALLIWAAELLGSFGAFEAVPYLTLVVATGAGMWFFAPRPPERGPAHPQSELGVGMASLRRDGRGWKNVAPTLIALAVALIAVVHFAAGVKTRLSTGMTGFDSTWYHGPFAAGFFQSGDIWSLHFIAPQFLAWFYPANSEIFHAVGMLAFGRDLLSPLLNLGWFVGCLLACWCIGRPYRVGPWSLALGAIALSVPALADQAGEARNDVVGIFFLLAAVAIALNSERSWRSALVVGLAAGLAAGTKLNFLLPALVLVVGLAVVSPQGDRLRAFAAAALAALAGGGYWYLRNLAHTGNPLPWVHHLGPIDLPAPQQALGGREAHSVLGYLSDGGVWSDWFLPGLHSALWVVWPLLLAAALAGLLLPLVAFLGRRRDENTPIWSEIGPSTAGWDKTLAVAGLVGLASAVAWLVAPTSASGPDGIPRGFESGLRYLAPALVLGLALLPTARPLRQRLHHLTRVWLSFLPDSDRKLNHTFSARRSWWAGGAVAALVLVAALGYPVQRHYLADRYRDPTFTTPGLNAAFAWARDVSNARIATTSTRQYPLFGTDLSNEVQYLGLHQPHGGFEAPRTCPQFLRLLDEGHYDYAIATRDRLEPGKPPYPPSAHWLESAGARPILRKPPTAVFELSEPLDPSTCGR